MSKLPAFYCTKTLLSYHPNPDTNRVTLSGPGGMQFALLCLSEPRNRDANERCNLLAEALSKLWEGRQTADVERIAKFMAETYNGGAWDDERFYTEEQREVHRGRARKLVELM